MNLHILKQIVDHTLATQPHLEHVPLKWTDLQQLLREVENEEDKAIRREEQAYIEAQITDGQR